MAFVRVCAAKAVQSVTKSVSTFYSARALRNLLDVDRFAVVGRFSADDNGRKAQHAQHQSLVQHH